MFHFKNWINKNRNSNIAASMDDSLIEEDPTENSSPCTTWFNPLLRYTHSIAIPYGFLLKSAPYLTLSISVDGSSLLITPKPLQAKAVVTVYPDSPDSKELLCNITIKELSLRGILSINVAIKQFSPIDDLNPTPENEASYQAETLFSNNEVVVLDEALGYECPECTTSTNPLSKLAITVSTPYMLTPDGRKIYANLPPKIKYDQTVPVTQAFLYALRNLPPRFLYIPLILEFEMEEKVEVTIHFEDAMYKGAFPDETGFITLSYKP